MARIDRSEWVQLSLDEKSALVGQLAAEAKAEQEALLEAQFQAETGCMLGTWNIGNIVVWGVIWAIAIPLGPIAWLVALGLMPFPILITRAGIRRREERERREEAKARYWNDRDPKTLEHFPTFIAIRDTLTGRTYDDDPDDEQ
jgi:hypothetical protein